MLPRYVQIAARLRERIDAGTYAVGTLLPTEAELSSEFDTSRNTVREALRQMVDQGAIRRRQGAGSIVLAKAPVAAYTQSFATLEDLFANARDTHFVVNSIADVALEPELAARIGAAAGSDWLLVTGVRWTERGGAPIAFVEAYVPSEFRALTETFWTLRIPFYAVLETTSGRPIIEVLQEVRAVAMPRRVSSAFGLDDGGLSLQLLRRYVTRQGTLITSINWHRGDQFTYQMRIARQPSTTA